jgi:hypothetical protein
MPRHTTRRSSTIGGQLVDPLPPKLLPPELPPPELAGGNRGTGIEPKYLLLMALTSVAGQPSSTIAVGNIGGGLFGAI